MSREGNTRIMTVGELRAWGNSLRPRLDTSAMWDLLREVGLSPEETDVRIECTWPDHVTDPKPDSNMRIRILDPIPASRASLQRASWGLMRCGTRVGETKVGGRFTVSEILGLGLLLLILFLFVWAFLP